MLVSPNWLFGGVYYFPPERARPCDINSEQRWFKSLKLSSLCFTPGTGCLTASIDTNSVLPRGLTNCTEDLNRNNGQAGGCGRKSANAFSNRRDWRDLWLVFDTSPFIPITPMMWPRFTAKPLILKRSKEVLEGPFTYPMDTSTSPY